MKIRIQLLSENAVLPRKAHPSDAGFDLVATEKWQDEFGSLVYLTGVAMEIPEGYVGLVFPRSSLSRYDQTLTNSVGVIDSGYRGEITFKFKPALNYHKLDEFTSFAKEYEVGDRIGQLIIIPIPDIEFELTDELSASDRGANGYGSTGK